MARWRVSGRSVWRRAGGRRGAEPAISTTSAELGLSWDDAPATTQAGFVSAIGLGGLRRLGAVAVTAYTLALDPATVTISAQAVPCTSSSKL